jgi:hypothetical protein
MATPIAARLPADSTTPPSLATRLHIFLIERRVAVSVALFAVVIAVHAAILRERPHDVLMLAMKSNIPQNENPIVNEI